MKKEITEYSDDAPPNSRLFIICGKDITEEDFRDAFESHGTVEKIEIHRDKNGNSKGLAYIKFSKTSEAAHALEQLNGRCIANHPRPLKVLVASNRDQNHRNRNNYLARPKEDQDRLLRLFVVVPKDKPEDDIKDYFSTFGDVQYVNIVKDKETKKSRGFAYVKYYRLIHAAAAFETCDRSYKPVFAEPRPPRPEYPPLLSPQSPHRALTHSASNESGSCVLNVLCSLKMTEDQLWRLFDLVPGLDFCELKYRDVRNNRGLGLAVFTNARAALYARDKLHGFEYPPGERLIVKLDTGAGESWHTTSLPPPPPPPPAIFSPPAPPQYLGDSMVQANNMMRTLHITPPEHHQHQHQHQQQQYFYDPAYCSIALPPPQPLAHPESPVIERLFIVSTPAQPPIYAVKDVFCRFGALIDLYFLNGKRCGYALFSQAEPARKAMAALNGQEVCGVRLKVMTAEPRKINDNTIQQQQSQQI